jgi:hypothetical protein
LLHFFTANGPEEDLAACRLLLDVIGVGEQDESAWCEISSTSGHQLESSNRVDMADNEIEHLDYIEWP